MTMTNRKVIHMVALPTCLPVLKSRCDQRQYCKTIEKEEDIIINMWLMKIKIDDNIQWKNSFLMATLFLF